MNMRIKDILIVTGLIALAGGPWIFYDMTGDISHALYGLGIDMGLFAIMVLDCYTDLKKRIKEIVKNDDENNA